MVSMRRLLRLLLLVQLGGAAAIGLAWWRFAGLPLPLALLAGLVAAVLVRLAISLNNFRVAARHAAGVPDGFRLSSAARLRMMAEEFMASMLQTSWLMARRAPPPAAPAATRGLPVLLLHGYGANGAFWTWLAPQLAAAGIGHAVLDLEPVTASIDDYAPAIERAAAALCRQYGSTQLIVVAHSMGGLAARAWMRAGGAARVARLITLGTPHHGTVLARLGIGDNAAQMRIGSAWLAALAASEPPALRARITSIFSWHDNIVAPASSSMLEGARLRPVGGVGHVALGRNARVLALVLEEIAAENQQGMPAPAQP